MRLSKTSITLLFFKTFKIRGIIFAIIGFFCYCALEQTAYIWFTSMLVFNMHVAEDLAAKEALKNVKLK